MDGKVILVSGFLLAYLAGRYSAPEKLKIETKTEYKEVLVQDENSKTNKVSRTIETSYPDGRKVKETRTRVKGESTKAIQSTIEEKRAEAKEVENRRGLLIGPLIGLHSSNPLSPIYGAHVSKQILGPFHLGGMLLSSPTFGIAFAIFGGIQL